ncbi:deoxyribonuclease-1-like isoform X1 [Lates japonicus]|uniref:Deoxyribonuclease-1-like isoform X1 n=1 Tax=Lates japonicus TaxID=270547 RepID=A0AAD3QVW9_LATJO|nr:deoxyribonuclease-1-like isoform X1 [Lates japonicus]
MWVNQSDTCHLFSHLPLTVKAALFLLFRWNPGLLRGSRCAAFERYIKWFCIRMKIASFNVRRFGLAKVSRPDVLSTLVKIVSRYDIILILEVVDVTGRSIKVFLEELNRVNTTHHYALQISTRLGRTRYKEQFLFLYRDDVVDLIDSYQYEDNQAFAREPYILHFKPHNTVLNDIVLIPVHTTPSDSEKELDELYEVFLMVRDKWKTDNIMILGDFNADGSYVTRKEMKEIRIRSDKNFHWLIGDDVDTTAYTSNDHTYDRIVVYGDNMLAATVPNSAKPFNFHTEFAMTEEMALRVSDHYPVEVELRSAPPFWMKRSDHSCDVVDTHQASVNRNVTGRLGTPFNRVTSFLHIGHLLQSRWFDFCNQQGFADHQKEDARVAGGRRETDSVPLVDDIRYHIASKRADIRCVEEANQKLEAEETLSALILTVERR